MNTIARHILLVEDNEDHAFLIVRQLEKASNTWHLGKADSLSTAYAYLTENKVDAILLDLYLPDSSGLETVRKVVNDYPRCPVIVLTSLNDEVIALEALQHGAQDYLFKDELSATILMRSIRYSIERKRLEQIKDEFVSIVSHELRTPLTSIYGSLGIIVAGKDGHLSDTNLKLINIAKRNCERLIRLINDLLDLKKMEAGEFAVSAGRIELIDLLERSIEANAGYAREHEVELHLGAEVEELWLEADSDRLLQVVANLVSNAVKSSPAGGVVVVAAIQKEHAVRVEVIDRGDGIPEESREHIFEKFTQIDSSTRRSKGGTGLGLSISKRIIELHGGQIGFESEVGEGTTFFFELPQSLHVPALTPGN